MSLGLLIGYGSIGKYHVRIAASRYASIAIVDQSSAAREQASADHADAVVVDSLAALDEHGWGWADSTATIAIWGPGHFDLFNDLVDRGVKRILCEKPIANSVANGNEMVARARRDNVALGVHHHRRYSGLTDGLNRLAKEHGLGEPVGVVIHGGAIGLVTTGIHHIDWASQFFGGAPVSVVSTALGEKLNPRSDSLELYGGAAIWTHPDGQETSFLFTNKSRISASMYVYYQDAIMDLDLSLNVVVRSRDPERIVDGAPMARVSPASEILYTGAIDEIIPVEQATGQILDQIDNGTLHGSLSEQAVDAMGACVGALEAGQTGQRVSLPIDPDSEIGQRTWPIS